MIFSDKAKFSMPILILMLVFLLIMIIPIAYGQTGNPPAQSAETSEDSAVVKDPVELYISHLRANYDDIHDVIMRFHLDNPHLRGQAVLRMIWKDGRLDSASVIDNDTGDKDFGPALIEAMRTWEIAGLAGPSEITIPIATRIVGSDNPEFDKKAILTGIVSDDKGKSLFGAKLKLIPGTVSENEPVTTRANREGVYIQTLIPADMWDLECSLEGYTTAIKRGIVLKPGMHQRVDFALKSVKLSE